MFISNDSLYIKKLRIADKYKSFYKYNRFNPILYEREYI